MNTKFLIEKVIRTTVRSLLIAPILAFAALSIVFLPVAQARTFGEYGNKFQKKPFPRKPYQQDFIQHIAPKSKPVCGNGAVDENETCDDGNLLAEDGCSPACQVELLMMLVRNPLESLCGNAAVEGNEACDDGNLYDGDGCSFDCREEIPMLVRGPLESLCGNGAVEGNEACDDGNVADGDGCSFDCREEILMLVRAPLKSLCGNGALEENEICDDGNVADGDGCSSLCQEELRKMEITISE